MGVPRFAPWLRRRYPRMVLKECPTSVAGLFVDVNGVIHPFCHGEGIDELPEEVKIKNIILYLELLVEVVQPTALLYLAVDGVAPRAKMNQQRARRYMSAASEAPLIDTARINPSRFDSNAISPGTTFMDRVTTALQQFIEEKLTTGSSRWQSLSIVLSDSNVPSEGEHKLIKFLRGQTGSTYFGKDYNVIVGLDADLIFLSMSLHTPRIALLRDQRDQGRNMKSRKKEPEESITDSFFEYFDMDVAAESLVTEIYQLSEFKGFQLRVDPKEVCRESTSGYLYSEASLTQGGTPFHPCTSPFNSKIIDDFIVMALIVGNDFLPHLPSAYCGESALDHALECYVDDVLPYGFLTLGGGELNPQQLTRFFRSYAEYEERLFLYAQQPDVVLTAAERTEGFSRLREIYYQTTKLEGQIEDVCRDYLHTFSFVWRYYTRIAEVDWRWYYPFHYSPFAIDICRYLETHAFVPASASMSLDNVPCEKFVQLLSILPPSSAQLVPSSCRALLCPSEKNLHVISEWQVDFTGTLGMDHMAAVLLPFVDMKSLEDQFAEVKRFLSPREKALNENVAYHKLYYSGIEENKADSFMGKRCMKKGETVICEEFLEVAPQCPRPRTYSFKAAINNCYALQNSSSLSTSHHTNMIDFVVVSCILSLVVMVGCVGFNPLQLILPVLQLLSLFAFVVVVIYMLNLAVRSAPRTRSGITRPKSNYSYTNWICKACNSSNFERQNECFFCAAPCDVVKSKAFFSGKTRQEAEKLYDPNHTRSLRTFKGQSC